MTKYTGFSMEVLGATEKSMWLRARQTCGQCNGGGRVVAWERGKQKTMDCGNCEGKGLVDRSVESDEVRAWLGLDVPKEA